MWRRRGALLLGFLLGLPWPPAGRAQEGGVQPVVRFRLATVMPARLGWIRYLESAIQEVEDRTSGRVRVDVFASGVLGDEPEIQEKLQKGDLEGAVLTGPGLMEFLPEVGALSLPFLIMTEEEVAFVKARYRREIEGIVRQRGLEILAWVDVGFGTLFSRYPVRRPEDLKAHKLWAPAELFMGREWTLEWGGIPAGFPISAVRRALEGGEMDSFFNTAFGCVALGWHDPMKYVLKARLGYTFGVMLVRSDHFRKVSEADRRTMSEVALRKEQEMSRRAARDEQAALNLLLKRGMQIIEPQPELLDHLQRATDHMIDLMSARGFPANWARGVWGEILEFRGMEKGRLR